MANLYRTKYLVRDVETSGIELFERVEQTIFDWAEDLVGIKIDGTGSWSTEKATLTIETGKAENYGFLLLSSTAPSGVTFTYRLATIGGGVENSVSVDSGDDVSPIRAPRIVSVISDRFPADFGGELIKPKAEVVSATGIPAFIDDQLFSLHRSNPLIVVSASLDGTNFVDPDALQRDLIGIAKVVFINTSAANALVHHLTKSQCRKLACYGGAIRLYRRGCNQRSFSSDHRMWMPGTVERRGGKLWRDIVKMRIPTNREVNTTFVFDQARAEVREAQYHRLRLRYESLRQHDIQTDLDDADRNQFENRQHKVESSDSKTERQLNDASSELETARLQLSQLADELEIEKKRSENLEIENRRIKRELQEYRDLLDESWNEIESLTTQSEETNQVNVQTEAHFEDQIDEPDHAYDPDQLELENAIERPQSPKPESVLDAVQWADLHLERLRFFPAAIKEARKSRYRPASKVYDAFRHLDEAAGLRVQYNDDFGTSLTDLFKSVGIDYVHDESESTSKKLADTRYFYDRENRRRRYMSEHIRIGGNQLRIHLTWDKSEKRWLIGHVGRHLETSKN